MNRGVGAIAEKFPIFYSKREWSIGMKKLEMRFYHFHENLITESAAPPSFSARRSQLSKLNSRDPQSMRRAVLYSACHSSAVPSSSPLLLGHLLPAVATSSPLSAPPPPPAFSVSAPPPPPDSRAGRGPPPPLGGDLIPQLWDPPPCLRAYLPPGGVRRRSKKLQKFKRGEEVTL